MPNTVNYAEKFERELYQGYESGLATAPLTTQNVQFLNAKTVHLPFISMGGYKDHSRAGGFNQQDVSNDFMTKVLAFDRDVQFMVDSMDVDETNEALMAANVTTEFLRKQAIPETDAYRISKLYSEFAALGGAASTTAITAANILQLWDDWTAELDDSGVPTEGRVCFMTPGILKLLKKADGVERSIDVRTDGALNRKITELDGVRLEMCPSQRMKTAFNFTNGWTPAASATQINMILLHPQSVIAVDKHSYIRLWAPGTHTEGDGWLYQNRKYGDLFVVDTRVNGIKINTDAPAAPPPTEP
jgi:ribosome modulation factor